jgi:hypothetical protein
MAMAFRSNPTAVPRHPAAECTMEQTSKGLEVKKTAGWMTTLKPAPRERVSRSLLEPG